MRDKEGTEMGLRTVKGGKRRNKGGTKERQSRDKGGTKEGQMGTKEG